MRTLIDVLKRLFSRRKPSSPLGMVLYDRCDRYAPPPKLTARTQAGLLGAHVAHAGRFTRGRK